MKRLFAAAIAATALCGAPVAAVPNDSDSILSNVSYTKVPALYTATARYAERALVDSGYCPVGTCSGQGGKWAQHTKYCSAKNCKIRK